MANCFYDAKALYDDVRSAMGQQIVDARVLGDVDELRRLRERDWVVRSDRGYEVLTYEQGFQALEHPGLRRGPGFMYRVDQLGIGGEARRVILTQLAPSEGEYRKHLRAPLAALFRPAQVKKLAGSVRGIARATVDELEVGSPVDLLEQFCWPIPSRTYCELVGMPHDQAPRVRRVGDSLLSPLLGQDRSRVHEAEEAILEGREMVREHLDARRKELLDEGDASAPAEDFTSVMIRQQLNGLLTEDELLNEAHTILQASVDNTAHQMAIVFGLLLTDRALWEAFLADRDLATALVEESIRLYPRSATVFRFAPEDVTIDGETFPAGSLVAVSAVAGQRDPDAFEDPDEFRLDRPRKRPLMFGSSVYNCLGQSLARLEIVEALNAVADRYPSIALTEPWELKITNTMSETRRLTVTL